VLLGCDLGPERVLCLVVGIGMVGFDVGARLLRGSTLLFLELDAGNGTVCERSGGSESWTQSAGVRVDFTPRFALSYDEGPRFAGLSPNSCVSPGTFGGVESKILRCASRFVPLVVLVRPALTALDNQKNGV